MCIRDSYKIKTVIVTEEEKVLIPSAYLARHGEGEMCIRDRYNASLTIDNYYSALVNHDFYGQDRSAGSKDVYKRQGLYARISVETERKREADTIGNQLQLLKDYVCLLYTSRCV